MKRTEVAYRRPDAADRDRIGEIDRTERITTSYVRRGACLEEQAVDWSASPWSSDGQGELGRASARRVRAAPRGGRARPVRLRGRTSRRDRPRDVPCPARRRAARVPVREPRPPRPGNRRWKVYVR